MGDDAWRNGVRSYIGKHAYGNAVTDDLWAEIEQAAPGKQIAAVAHDFTLQPGVPLIKASSACVDGSTRVQLEQGEYTVDRPGKTPLRWRVPVSVRAGDGKAVRVLVDGKASVSLPGCSAPALVNAGQNGYFRTLYAPAQFKALRSGFATLPVVDQMGLMLDAGALAAVGLQPESDSLDLAMQVPAGAAPELWQMVAGSLGGLDDLFKGDAKRQAAIHAFAIKRLAPKFAQLGWDNRAGDSAATRQLRNTLISTLGELGDAAVLAEARRRFDAFLADPASLSPDLRRTVLGMVARNADVATWERLHALARQEKSSMLRDQYYGLLARAKDKALAQRALDMALTDEPGATNGAAMISAVSWEHPDAGVRLRRRPSRAGGQAGRFDLARPLLSGPGRQRQRPGDGGEDQRLRRSAYRTDLAPRRRARGQRHPDPGQAAPAAAAAGRCLVEAAGRLSAAATAGNEEAPRCGASFLCGFGRRWLRSCIPPAG